MCVCSFSGESDSLSQWRAYGGSSGFAIGFAPEVLGAAVEKQNFFLVQCIYDPAAQRDVVRALVEEVLDEYISKSPIPAIVTGEGEFDKESVEIFWKTGGNLLPDLYTYAPILKDHSFEEEREWRIISRPISAHHLDYLNEGLFVPQCDDRIDVRSPASGHITRGSRNGPEQHGHGNDSCRIIGLNAVKH